MPPRFVPPAYQSELTNKLEQNPNTPLAEVILDTGLAMCVRHDAPGLINYLVAPRAPKPHVVSLVEWALSDEWRKYFPDPSKVRLAQPSRNAANVLSTPNKKFWAALTEKEPEIGARVFERVVRFVIGLENEMGREGQKVDVISYAGHWQRIVDCFFRQDPNWIPAAHQGEFFRRMFENLLTYVEVLAYQQLLLSLALDFPFILEKYYRKDNTENAIHAYILVILNKAFEYTIQIESYSRKAHDQREKNQTLVHSRALGQAAKDQQKAKSQLVALSTREVAMLSPPILYDRAVPNPYGSGPKYKQHLQTRIEQFGLTDRAGEVRRELASATAPEEVFTTAVTCAYLLLSTIDQLLIESPQLLAVLQRLPDDPQVFRTSWEPSVLEYLLAIGVYSDKSSPIAPLAFRLVRLIAHGYNGLRYKFRAGEFEYAEDAEITKNLPLLPRFRHPVYDILVTAYAEDFLFSYPLTPQMVAGFEIFWNHRYKELRPSIITDDRNLDKERYPDIELDVVRCDYATVMRTWTWKRPRGYTPLEVYAHFLFYDPAPSDFFTQAILKVINFYHDYTRQFRNPESIEFDNDDEYAEYQEKLFGYDILFFDVLRTVFRANDGKVINMTAIGDLLPCPHERLSNWDRKKPIRAPVNGAPMEFALLWKASEFFTDGGGPTAMLDPAPKMLDEVSVQLEERTKTYEVFGAKVTVDDGTPETPRNAAGAQQGPEGGAPESGFRDKAEDATIPVPESPIGWSSLRAGASHGRRK